MKITGEASLLHRQSGNLKKSGWHLFASSFMSSFISYIEIEFLSGKKHLYAVVPHLGGGGGVTWNAQRVAIFHAVLKFSLPSHVRNERERKLEAKFSRSHDKMLKKLNIHFFKLIVMFYFFFCIWRTKCLFISSKFRFNFCHVWGFLSEIQFVG